MPEYNGGYYRQMQHSVEYWHSVHDYGKFCQPDGIIEINSQEAIRTAKIRIDMKGMTCQTENANDDTTWARPGDDGTHIGDPSGSPEDSGCNELDFQKCAAKRGFLVVIRDLDDKIKRECEACR